MRSQPDDTVAVVIPCYNAETTLAASVLSATTQHLQPQVVIIDDGSTDNSLSIARSFEPQVRVMTGPNRGVSFARNMGISVTTSEWILFLDADDMLKPDTLARRIEVAKSKSADVVICDWMEEFTDKLGRIVEGQRRNVDRSAIEKNAELIIAKNVWAPTAAILYRRSIVNHVGGFRVDLPIIQDARFLFDAVYSGARIAIAEHIGAIYRMQPGTLSRRDPGEFWSDVLKNAKQIEELLRKRRPLSKEDISVLADMYNDTARGLFDADRVEYFDAVERQYALGTKLPLHTRLARPLARAIGVRGARLLLSSLS
jgi:glycosyltransferase involved in cell wall biosynthesis